MSKEVVMVAGTACEAENLAIFNSLENTLTEQYGYSVSYVNGVRMEGDTPFAVTPSEQTKAIAEIFDNSKDNKVVVAHSTGSVAAVAFLERYDGYAGRAVLLSPPLPAPWDVKLHPRLQERMKLKGKSIVMGSKSHPQGVVVSSDFFDDISEANGWFSSAVYMHSKLGSVGMVLASRDWNTPSLEIGGQLPGSIIVSGGHSMGDISQEDVLRICETIDC